MSNWLNVNLVLHMLGENIPTLLLHIIVNIVNEHKVFLLLVLILSMMTIVIGDKILQCCPLRFRFLTITSLFNDILDLTQVIVVNVVTTCP